MADDLTQDIAKETAPEGMGAADLLFRERDRECARPVKGCARLANETLTGCVPDARGGANTGRPALRAGALPELRRPSRGRPVLGGLHVRL